MSGDNDNRSGRKDLRLVKPRPEVEPADSVAQSDALRAAMAPTDLAPADHEALLALTLGDDVLEVDPAERAEAEALRRALEGDASHPLADLAVALSAAHEGAAAREGSAGLESVDHELLIALSIGDDAADLREVAEAEDLRVALSGQGSHPLADLAEAVRAAHTDVTIEPSDNEVLVAFAAGGDVEDEEAERLRDALDALPRRGNHGLADLAGALRAARAETDLDMLSHERILRRMLGKAEKRVGAGMIVGSIVALAAGFALFIGALRWLDTDPVAHRPTVDADLVMARSTTDLFDPLEKFPTKGGESERMDKIVSSRAGDLRANRFAAWGVR